MKASTQLKLECLALFAILAGIVGILLGADVYLHKKYAATYGVNHEGYRGEILGPKKADEKRIAIIGGSLAFGYGTPVKDSVSQLLEERIKSKTNGNYKVVNLAFNTERASSFPQILKDYSYLDFDVVIVLAGGSDLASAHEGVSPGRRYGSWIYRYLGYYTILPINFSEKMKSIRFGGDLTRAYLEGGRGNKTVVFRAGQNQWLEVAVAEFNKQEAPKVDPAFFPTAVQKCDVKWLNYCNSIYHFVDSLSKQGLQVIVSNEPATADYTREQQASLSRMLPLMPGVKYATLTGHMDGHDKTLIYDGAHLSEKGSSVVADVLTAPAIEALKKTEQHPKKKLPDTEKVLKRVVRKLTSFITV